MKPIVVLSRADAQCATFYWPGQEFFIGYRFIEHDPETMLRPLPGIGALPINKMGVMPVQDRQPMRARDADPLGLGWVAHYAENDPADAIQLAFQSFADGSAWARGNDNRGAQRREFFFEPVDDGLLIWMRLVTDVNILGAFAVQQCLRFSGGTNEPWRQRVALFPRLSEFDMQAKGRPHDTLTWARSNDQWLPFPLPHTAYHTPPGKLLLGARSSGAVDHGLIVRESLDHSLTSGMYWERTAYITNRQPADCVHASVGFGPLARGETRTVRGRFYLIEGTKDDVLQAWKGDFG